MIHEDSGMAQQLQNKPFSQGGMRKRPPKAMAPDESSGGARGMSK
jgi:hypothetical protein